MKSKIFNFLNTFLVFAFSGVLNYFGANPRILYLPAVALWAWISWIIFAGVHTYISKQESISEKQGTNVKIEEIPTSLTQDPTKIISEIRNAQPFQRDGVSKSFVGTVVVWRLRIDSIDRVRLPSKDMLNVSLLDEHGTPVYAWTPITASEQLSLVQHNSLLLVKGVISSVNSLGVNLEATSLEIIESKTK